MPEFKPIPVGTRFARLIVLAIAKPIAEHHGILSSTSLCRCDCGNEKVIRNSGLKTGNTKSCGCIGREKVTNLKKSHGKSASKTYGVWCTMIQRCTNPKVYYYERYGGRGIKVCERWRALFANFLADMGECPPGLSIDRIDNNGNYSCGKCAECLANGWPMNCRWATRKEQARNNRGNRILSIDGVTGCLAEMAERFGIKKSILAQRLGRGWTLERAIKEPLRQWPKPYKNLPQSRQP